MSTQTHKHIWWATFKLSDVMQAVQPIMVAFLAEDDDDSDNESD